MSHYVNPKVCAHRWVDHNITSINGQVMVFAKCRVCELEGQPVKLGLFGVLARCRATRSFYRIANQIDKENPHERHQRTKRSKNTAY